jgi:signal transduction histidine kinase
MPDVDITERKRLEETLSEANEQLERKVEERTARLRQLTEELIRAEHGERRRIAHVLHAQLQQNLCAMKFHTHDLKGKSTDHAVIGRIQVGDAGVGSDSKQGKPGNGHFGLFRIQERVESLGGRFEMVS